MKIFIYSGPGGFIGATVVVCALSKKIGIRKIKEQLSFGLKPPADDIIEDHITIHELDKPKVLFWEDGDY